jgi:proteasome lid subunit RPN8/RPN11
VDVGNRERMTAIAISDELLARIYAHAREAFPDECCGYLLDDEVVRCRNAQEDGEMNPDRGADRGFVISGRELFDFARSFDTDRPARVVYHSHPNGRAYFSETDRTMALAARYPVQHLVVGVTADAVIEAAQFAIVDDDVLEVARWHVNQVTR